MEPQSELYAVISWLLSIIPVLAPFLIQSRCLGGGGWTDKPDLIRGDGHIKFKGMICITGGDGHMRQVTDIHTSEHGVLYI